MLARPKIVCGSNARNYYENDTYYLNNEFEQGSFYGKLKDEFLLQNFNLEDFDKLLRAENQNTGEVLLNLSKKDFDEHGERKRAALDLTFATDKSISVLYETLDESGKKELRKAFTHSVDIALDFIESNYAYTKKRDVLKGEKAENKMLFTRFDHSESRNNDMHLHQHVLAMNFVKNKKGEWRSMEFNQIMENHQFIGQIQRNALALELQKLGYEVEVSDPKNGFFKLKNVDRKLTEIFSTRSKNIKEEMEQSGQSTYKSTHTAQKQTAKWKDKNKDRLAIEKENIEKLLATGANIDEIRQKSEIEIKQVPADTIVQMALDDITNKKSVFSKEEVLKQALKLSLTMNTTVDELERAIANSKVLELAENQYSTQEIIDKEEYIFSQNIQKSFPVTKDKNQIEKAIKNFENEKGFELKSGQNSLTHAILSSHSRYIIAQGIAGTGKSTSVEIVRNVCVDQNIKIVALAPTASATDNLAKEAKIADSFTVAKFIQAQGAEINNALILVDEAGMLGTRDAYELMKIAEKNNLKIVFSGDTNQKKSIAQGDIFGAMQEKDFEVINLDEGNRQKSQELKKAVSQILKKDISGALKTLKNSTSEIKNSDERLVKAKELYIQDRENSLLITTTNHDRKVLNESIRSELLKNGEISESKSFTTKEMQNLSELEKRHSRFYTIGEGVFLSKNIGQISAGREATIKDIDMESNTLTIEHSGKNQTFVEVIDLLQEGHKLNSYKTIEKPFGVGDQIIFKKNDKKLNLKNGQIAKITRINDDQITININGKEATFSSKAYPYIDHAYAITDFASQGKTTNKVIVVANSQTVSLNDFYTQITRAKYEAHVITDDLARLQERAKNESIKQNAIDIYTQKIHTQKGDKQMKMTVLQQAITAIENKEENTEVIYGKEKTLQAKEIIEFFAENAENLGGIQAHEIPNKNIFEKIKSVIEEGIKITREWLESMKNHEREQTKEHENEL